MVVAAWLPTTQNKFQCARVLLAPSVLGDLFTSAEYLPVTKTVANQAAQQASYISCISRVKSACNAYLVFRFSPKNLTTFYLLGFVRSCVFAMHSAQCLYTSNFVPLHRTHSVAENKFKKLMAYIHTQMTRRSAYIHTYTVVYAPVPESTVNRLNPYCCHDALHLLKKRLAKRTPLMPLERHEQSSN